MSKSDLVEKLKVVLADSYLLYLKTHNYHWNVTGANFQSLHLLFETQYTDLATAVDDIAERIRALGSVAPGSFRQFLELASLAEAGDGSPAAGDMVKELACDQDAIVKTLTTALKDAQTLEDEATIGLLVDRITVHEKNAWMLRSSL